MQGQQSIAGNSSPGDATYQSINAPLRWTYFAPTILIYKYLLDLSYEYIAIAYSYQNLFVDERVFGSQFLSWAMLIFVLPMIKRIFDDRSISGNVFSLLILFSVVPTITAIGFRPDYGYPYVIMMSVFWTIFYLAWLFTRPIYLKSLSMLRSRWYYIITLVTLCSSVFIYSYINTGLRFHFDIIGVYDIRAEARDFEAPFPLNYFVSFADNLLPVILILLLIKRQWLLAAVVAFFIFLNFSISGQKQNLFVPALGVVGYFLFRYSVRTYYIIGFGVVLTLLCLAEAYFLNGNTLHGLFTYRVLFIPTELHFTYYSYFQSHDILWFTQSIFRAYGNPGQENIQFVIGEYAIGEYTARANNGLFSDAYMNLGIGGLLIYPILYVLFLRILDGAVVGLKARMIFVIVVYVAFVLMSMTLPAALITSGLAFLIFLLYSLPRDDGQPIHGALPTVGASPAAGPR